MNAYHGRYPDARGHFGPYGGRFVGETLMTPLMDIEAAWKEAKADAGFMDAFHRLLRDYAGRPTPLDVAERLSDQIGGARIYLKREDCTHTGAHKINNVLGQGLLAQRMGRRRIIAETGAGQHGVASATIAARFGMECKVFMGEEDIRRQAPNVQRMELLGADVVPVRSGTRTLKDAMNEALRYWAGHAEDTFYIIGTVSGPHPYPEMVRDFQRVIGDESRRQILEKIGRLPDLIVACVGGGSNAMGMFYPFLEDPPELLGAEAAGKGLHTSCHAASISGGSPGELHGAMTYLLQDRDGQIQEAWSISAGLDYPGVGPEHALLKDLGRVRYEGITDEQAVEAFQLLCRTEGIIPALESSHALASAIREAARRPRKEAILVCLSGRGDKDLQHVQTYLSRQTNSSKEGGR
ncbi:MAG: tryptophan synthase subunit beta [Verrucomicrobiota bacterium]|jgi:tryptophan synthase beta chain|nr:tryptophan synthase subunit beta [Verrucomicrobiota bacterium]